MESPVPSVYGGMDRYAVIWLRELLQSQYEEIVSPGGRTSRTPS
jgi:hypothetical protein